MISRRMMERTNFIANKPFLFYVHDRTTIYFIGRVNFEENNSLQL